MDRRLQTGARRLAAITGGLAVGCLLAAGSIVHAQEPPPRQAAAARQDSAAVVEGYSVPAGDLNALAVHLQQQFAAHRDVRIAADARSRKIVAIAPPELQRQIAAAIAQGVGGPGLAAPGAPSPDPAIAPPAGPPNERRSLERLRLQHVTWKQFEDKLIQIWGTRLTAATNAGGDAAQFQIRSASGQTTLEIDRRRGQVTIDAPGQTAAAWIKVVQAIDAPAAAPGGEEAQVVPLTSADPATVMRAVSLIRSAIENDPRGRLSPNRKTHIGQFVSMIFQQEGAQPAEQPAVQPQPGAQPPEGGQPGAEEAPGGVIPGGRAGILGVLDDAQIGNVTIDIVGDVIVVRGRQRDVERVLRIIEEIERQSVETRPEVELYLLRHVDSTALSEVLTAITPTALAYQGTVTITPLQRPNALVLVGRKENIPAVVELIQKLDQPTPPDSRLKVFYLKYMSAIDMERTLRQFFANRPGFDTNLPTGLGTRVKVIAEFRANAIIVQASPRDLAEVAQIIAKLDVDKTPSESEVRVFKLSNSIAEELAPALQEAITGVGAAGQPQQQQQQQAAGGAGGQQSPAIAQRPAVSLQLLRIGPEGEQLIQSGVLSNMRITADTRSNSLIVVGPPSAMELMAALIDQLDTLAPVEAQIKVFTITNGDATTLVQMLQQLFGQQQQGGGQQGLLGLQTATGAGESTLVPLRFSVDQRTNSIIVSGNAGDLDVVRNIIVRLDVPDMSQRIMTIYRLNNAPAGDVATAINNLLDRQRELNEAAPELITPYQQIEREVLIEPEIITNSLIVSATPRYFEAIKRIITELDRRPPMVVIQVLIAEVELTDNEQFGVEWGLQDSLMFDRSILTNRFGFNNSTLPNDNTPESLATRELLAGQALSNLGVGRIDPALGFGGLVLTASNESVQMLLRALQASSRVQIISRPQVQTLDNQLAYVNVGALVPRITGSNVNGLTVTPIVEDISVGIILEVTPRTSPDGTIVMQINATKSSVGDEATGIPVFTDANGNVVRSPQIPLTTAQTIVSARSGQTVILGGLITKDQTESTRRIPYLGDIPVLGRLFRFDTVANQRTELLIIMTPYIIQNEEQNEWLNQRETERMSWCIADVVNIHGPVGISGNPAFNMLPPDVIFPDVDPTAPEPTPDMPPLPGLPGSPPTMMPPVPVPAPGVPGPASPLPPTPLLPPPAPLLPPPPPGGYGLELPPPPVVGPNISARRNPGPAELQQPLIQPVVPPPGTQAQYLQHAPPQFGPPQGPAPPVAPAVYQR
jgi:type II secretion system protein D